MSLIRAITNTHKWYNRAMIPNQEGFRFVGKLIDNTEVQCIVAKRGVSHYVEREDGKDFLWATLKEWRYH